MKSEKDYLIQLLKTAGIKSAVYTSMKKLKMANEMHLGAVLRSNEVFRRSKSKKTFIDQEGVKRNRHKIWERITELKIVIAAADEETCEEILEKFLFLIPKGIFINGNWVSIELGEADWVEQGDSILKSKIAVEMPVTFQGGLYKDEVMKQINIGEVKRGEDDNGGKKSGNGS